MVYSLLGMWALLSTRGYLYISFVSLWFIDLSSPFSVLLYFTITTSCVNDYLALRTRRDEPLTRKTIIHVLEDLQ